MGSVDQDTDLLLSGEEEGEDSSTQADDSKHEGQYCGYLRSVYHCNSTTRTAQ